MLKLNKMRDIFHRHNVQVSPDVCDDINNDIHSLISGLAIRCEECNIKRLTSDIYNQIFCDSDSDTKIK